MFERLQYTNGAAKVGSVCRIKFLEPEIYLRFRNLLPVSQKTHFVSITKPLWLMSFMQLINVHCDSRIKHITKCVLKWGFLNVGGTNSNYRTLNVYTEDLTHTHTHTHTRARAHTNYYRLKSASTNENISRRSIQANNHIISLRKYS
jgi:hypothetical protein